MVQILENPAVKQPPISNRVESFLLDMFDNVCQTIEEIDGSKLDEQRWTRDERGQWVQGENSNGAIYIDKSLRNGNVFEKVGINYVSMQGELPPGVTFRGSDVVMADQQL